MNDYAELWLSEMWKTCPELPRVTERQKKPRAATPRAACPICGTEYTKTYIPDHIARIHPESPGYAETALPESA